MLYNTFNRSIYGLTIGLPSNGTQELPTANRINIWSTTLVIFSEYSYI